MPPLVGAALVWLLGEVGHEVRQSGGIGLGVGCHAPALARHGQGASIGLPVVGHRLLA